MTKLKTFKDIAHFMCEDKRCVGDDYCETYSRIDLKTEAINWIKELEKKIRIAYYTHTGQDDSNFPINKGCSNWIEVEDDYYSFCGCVWKYRNQIEWIKMFFEITEEEIKGVGKSHK